MTALPEDRTRIGCSHRMRWGLLSVLLFAVLTRLATLALWSENLSTDPDAYRGIAANVINGDGFSIPETKRPTAYRPPLYPLFLAMLGNSPLAIGFAQLVLSVITVWLTFRVGALLHSESAGLLAAVLVAIDPLILQSISLPMTETLFTFLLLILLWSMLQSVCEPELTRWRILSGVCFGLCALCRPTIWAWGGLLLLWGSVKWCASRRRSNSTEQAPPPIPWGSWAALAIVVAPWVVRNQLVMHKPIVMTTHGGYTLLLANNPVFYQEVVNEPWGTTWTGESLSAWKLDVERELASRNILPTDETSRSKVMSELAKEQIRKHPPHFLRACVLRFKRFWNLAPQGEAALSPLLSHLVTTFYISVLLTALVGVAMLLRTHFTQVMPLVLLPVSFTCVHLVYWSNMRMRTPLMPVLAIFSGVVIGKLFKH